jgi:hypothetical protein
MAHERNAGQDHKIHIAYNCFENMGWFMYLVTVVTNQNYFQKEIEKCIASFGQKT